MGNRQFRGNSAVLSQHFLHNNCFFYEKTALCGTRGWPFEEDFADPHNEKIFKRELLRLEASLKLGAEMCIRDSRKGRIFLEYVRNA